MRRNRFQLRLRNELDRVSRALEAAGRDAALPERFRHELYGAFYALSWIVSGDRQPPSTGIAPHPDDIVRR